MRNWMFVCVWSLGSLGLWAQQSPCNLIVGTYTNGCKSEGIYVYDFNPETAQLTLKSQSSKVSNPSFLSLSPEGKTLYAVNEDGAKSGVSSFSFDAASGSLKPLNRVASKGADACHVICDEQNVLVANYSGGNLSVFKRKPDGSLPEAAQTINHKGKSIDKQRQGGPHVHQLTFSPSKKMVLANDLGTDRVYVYDYHPESASEILTFKDTIPIKSGSGPRHLTLSKDGRFAYLLQELDGTLTVFAHQNGKLRRIQEASIVQPGFTGNGGADIHLSPDGNFLYATNRGDANTIAVFSVDALGKIVLRKIIPSGGKGPRNFAISPDGKFLLVAHQYTNDITIFTRDAESGLLKDTAKKVELCAPVCLLFAPY